MPTYEYRCSGDSHCELCAEGFDVVQKISDPRLEHCPQCEAPIRRLISAVAINKPGPALDRSQLEKHGFTQYKRAGKGVYEKTAGKGPDVIKGD